MPAGGIPRANGAVADHPGGSPAPPPLPVPPGCPRCRVRASGRPWCRPRTATRCGVATVRPDAAHTSFLAGVLWMDPTLVRGVLHPGTEDPGGSWSVPSSVDATEQRTVADRAFSAGFRLQGDSHGGWYRDGREPARSCPAAPAW